LQEFAGVSAPSGTASSAETAFSTDQFANYQMALRGPIDRKAGLATFKRLCSTCHRVAGVGNQVGPDLKSLRDKAEDQILLSIMDPNREIDPRYRLVQIETVDGRIFAGIIERENDSELLLIDGQAKRHRVAREEIAALRTTDRSLMPTGLFDEITPDQMRHLIGLLKEKGS
jgi:putative heme-binding domain-containing protein